MVIYISTPTELNAIRYGLSADYELSNDIDMSTFGNFTPIANFKGQFDGKGFKIKNLTINVSSGYVGLFSSIDNISTVIQNVGIEDCNVNSNNTNWTGAFVGSLRNGTIQNCYSTGVINGQYMIGGIVGQFTGGRVKNSYSHATVSSIGRVGGLIGYIGSSNAIVENCYSTGITTSTTTSYPAHGLIGDNVDTSFSNVINSYWDINSSTLTNSKGGTGLTTSQFADSSNFTNWDSNVWGFSNYPYLKIFGIPSLPAQVVEITLNSHLNTISNVVDVSKRKLCISFIIYAKN